MKPYLTSFSYPVRYHIEYFVKTHYMFTSFSSLLTISSLKVDPVFLSHVPKVQMETGIWGRSSKNNF